jgi:hypothetical protein
LPGLEAKRGQSVFLRTKIPLNKIEPYLYHIEKERRRKNVNKLIEEYGAI